MSSGPGAFPPDGPAVGAVTHLASYLSLLQLTDSAFPSGRYTLSYGLEAFAQSGQLTLPSRPSTLVALLARLHPLRSGAVGRRGAGLCSSRRGPTR